MTMVGGRFIYISQVREDLDDQALQELAARAAAKNARRNITGVLMKTGDFLVQIVDGPYFPATSLLQTISKDTRHAHFHLLYKEPVTLGLFSDWSMGYLNLDATSQSAPQSAGKVRDAINDLVCNLRPTKDCMTEVVQSLPDLVDFLKKQRRYA